MKSQAQLAFPQFKGEALTQLPDDLFIPPEALEIYLEDFSGPIFLIDSLMNFALIGSSNQTWRAIFIIFLISGIGRSIGTIPFLRLRMPKKYPSSIYLIDRLMEFRMFKRR